MPLQTAKEEIEMCCCTNLPHCNLYKGPRVSWLKPNANYKILARNFSKIPTNVLVNNSTCLIKQHAGSLLLVERYQKKKLLSVL
jgi:hypothetical protein